MKKSIDTTSVFKYHLLVLKLVGLSPPAKNVKYYKLYRCFECIQKIFTFSLLASFCIECGRSENLRELCERFFMASTDIKCITTAIFLQSKRMEFHKLSKIFHKLDGHVIGSDEVLVLQIALKSVYSCFKWFIVLFLLILFYCEMITILSSEPTLPFSVWLPWEWKRGGFRFTLAHFYFSIGMIFSAFLELLGDTFPQACLCILSGHLRALSLRFGRIKIPDSQQEYLAYAELLTCIKDHQLILE